MSDDFDAGHRDAARLEQIATILGVPVSAFYGEGPLAAEMRRLAELLDLWATIRDEAVQEAVLACVRILAAAP